MILVISHEADVHSEAVWRALESRGNTPALLDLARYPRLASVDLAYGNGHSGAMKIQDEQWGEVDLTQVRAAWWRRPQPFGLPDDVTDPVHRGFAVNEAREVFGGLWGLLDAEWINDPQRDDLAHRKSFQLRQAEAVGMRIPETLITSDPESARAFIGAREKTVFKAFSGTPQAWRETRLIGDEEIAALDLVRIAPVIFQEYIQGVDLRVTVIGDRIFPAEIDIQGGDYSVDFRMNYDSLRIRPTTLPPEIEEQIHRLMERLGLVYGAVDFRRRPDGEHVFLEINPAGQWLFIEQHTGQPITEAMADALIARDRPN